ncbi:MAG: hypothetical protein Q9221_001062 [Calogaya cf. arnoldii]
MGDKSKCPPVENTETDEAVLAWTLAGFASLNPESRGNISQNVSSKNPIRDIGQHKTENPPNHPPTLRSRYTQPTLLNLTIPQNPTKMTTITDPLETFTLLPLSLDPTSKALSSPLPHLTTPLSNLTQLQRSLLSTPSQTPPPPSTTNPKRSAQIAKMRDQGNASLRKTSTSSSTSSFEEAITLYTYGLEMALTRPSWEPVQLVREECALLYSNRAQAYMGAQMWAEAAADAECSVECKRTGNSKAWWRRGKSLCEMGRWAEAGRWVSEGLEVEGEKEGGKEREELVGLGKEIERYLEGERGR